MEDAVVWLVIWAAAALFASPIVYVIGFGLGLLIAAATDSEGLVFVGILLGWIGGVAFFIFAAIQVVLQIISVVQLA